MSFAQQLAEVLVGGAISVLVGTVHPSRACWSCSCFTSHTATTSTSFCERKPRMTPVPCGTAAVERHADAIAGRRLPCRAETDAGTHGGENRLTKASAAARADEDAAGESR